MIYNRKAANKVKVKNKLTVGNIRRCDALNMQRDDIKV